MSGMYLNSLQFVRVRLRWSVKWHTLVEETISGGPVLVPSTAMSQDQPVHRTHERFAHLLRYVAHRGVIELATEDRAVSFDFYIVCATPLDD